MPFATVSVTVRLVLSTSLTERPVMAVSTSSCKVTGPGTVLTGASLTAITLTVATAVLELAAPSLVVTLIVRAMVEGLSDVVE